MSKRILTDKIQTLQYRLEGKQNEINNTQQDIDKLNEKLNELMERKNEYQQEYNNLQKQLDVIKTNEQDVDDYIEFCKLKKKKVSQAIIDQLMANDSK